MPNNKKKTSKNKTNKKLNENSNELFNCCLKCYKTPLIGLENKKDNVYLYYNCPNRHKSKLNIFSFYEERKIKCFDCSQKKNKDEIFYCFSCKLFLCKKCKENHSNCNCKNFENYSLNCKIHNYMNQKYYCYNCLIGFCEKCINEHKNHETNKIENYLFSELELSKIKTIKDYTKKQIENIHKKFLLEIEIFESTVRNLRKSYEKLIKINNKEIEITEKLISKIENSKNKITFEDLFNAKNIFQFNFDVKLDFKSNDAISNCFIAEEEFLKGNLFFLKSSKINYTFSLNYPSILLDKYEEKKITKYDDLSINNWKIINFYKFEGFNYYIKCLDNNHICVHNNELSTSIFNIKEGSLWNLFKDNEDLNKSFQFMKKLKNNHIIIGFSTKLVIYEINSKNLKPIQVIYNKQYNLDNYKDNSSLNSFINEYVNIYEMNDGRIIIFKNNIVLEIYNIDNIGNFQLNLNIHEYIENNNIYYFSTCKELPKNKFVVLYKCYIDESPNSPCFILNSLNNYDLFKIILYDINTFQTLGKYIIKCSNNKTFGNNICVINENIFTIPFENRLIYFDIDDMMELINKKKNKKSISLYNSKNGSIHFNTKNKLDDYIFISKILYIEQLRDNTLLINFPFNMLYHYKIFNEDIKFLSYIDLSKNAIQKTKEYNLYYFEQFENGNVLIYDKWEGLMYIFKIDNSIIN